MSETHRIVWYLPSNRSAMTAPISGKAYTPATNRWTISVLRASASAMASGGTEASLTNWTNKAIR